MSHSLHVARLTLTTFRNHAALDLELDARPVCLFGPNGAGKTNILEALTMLAPGRGLRSASLTDVALANEAETRAQPWATIRGDFGVSRSYNLIHGSDSPEAAEREISLFFEADEVVEWQPAGHKWVYDAEDLA
jgi:DNA replication and repair protein RecF